MGQPLRIAERRLGEYILAVERTVTHLGPYMVRQHGNGTPRVLACMFKTEESARAYLKGASCETIMLDTVDRRFKGVR